MRRALLVLVLFVISIVAASCRHVQTPLYGITFDNDADASAQRLNDQAALIQALPVTPTVRVVLDPGTTPDDYADAFARFQPIAYTLAELVDSSSVAQTSLAAYEAKTTAFVEAFTDPDPEATDLVDFFEVGNEVNGNWLGSYSSVAAKVRASQQIVHDAGKRSALTLWENTFGSNHCGNGSGEETPEQFSQRIPAAERERYQLVMISWYPEDCTGKPNGNDRCVDPDLIRSKMEGLRALWPKAQIGFGEIGISTAATTPAKVAIGAELIDCYYNLDLGLPAWYVGHYSWWYAAQDACCPHTSATSAPLFDDLAAAMG